MSPATASSTWCCTSAAPTTPSPTWRPATAPPPCSRRGPASTGCCALARRRRSARLRHRPSACRLLPRLLHRLLRRLAGRQFQRDLRLEGAEVVHHAGKAVRAPGLADVRSEEHTSELQ